jgi:hypothetical protein
MLEVNDYSNRRGAMVPLLPKIHEMLAEASARDTVAGIKPPINYILWKQEISRRLVDIYRRWVAIMDGPVVAGVFFYHFGDKDKSIYIDELRIAWAYRNNNTVINMLCDRFANDNAIKKVSSVYASENIKKESSQEILATVGFEKQFENGWEPLGNPVDAAAAIKLRYSRP